MKLWYGIIQYEELSLAVLILVLPPSFPRINFILFSVILSIFTLGYGDGHLRESLGPMEADLGFPFITLITLGRNLKNYHLYDHFELSFEELSSTAHMLPHLIIMVSLGIRHYYLHFS